MTYCALFFQIIMSFSLFALFPTMTLYTQGMMSQMQDFEKELEEANRAIEEYIASLPAEEQAEFNRQVEEMSKMFENMNEEEFEKFLGEMFTPEEMAEASNFEITPPPAPEEVITVVLSAEDKKKVETAIAILDDIINQSNLFMVIVNSSPDLPSRIERWGSKKEISHWQSELNWNGLKLEIERLIQKLYRAEEQDLVTQKYKYLFELITDEALYNNLIQLRNELNSLVPVINIPEFNVQKLSEQSKNAIKNIVAKYLESFQLLSIPKSLDDLFEKYAPEAEKIRAAEESATKRAFEASKGIRIPTMQTEAGLETDTGYDYGYDYSSGYGRDYDYGYSPYGSNYDYGYSPNYGSYESDYNYGSDRSRDMTGGGYDSGRSTTGTPSFSGETDEDKKDLIKKDKSKKKQFIPGYDIERAIADMKTGLEDIAAVMIDEEGKPTKLAKLAEHINNPGEEVDVILAGSTLPTIVDKKMSMISDAFEKINDKRLNAYDLAHYQRETKKIFEKHQKDLETLRDAINMFGTKEEIDKEEEARRATPGDDAKDKKKINIETLSPEKQWAYFGGDENKLGTDDATEKLKEAITSRTSLFDIRDTINKILESSKKFLGKVSETTAPEVNNIDLIQ